MEDIALDMRLRLKSDAQAPDRADHAATHDDVLGHDAANHLRLVAEQKRAAIDVALDFAVDLDLALRGDIPGILRSSPMIEGTILLAAGLGLLLEYVAGRSVKGVFNSLDRSPPIFVTLSPNSGFLVNIIATSPSQL